MQTVRALLLGLAVVALTLVASTVLLTTIPKKVSLEDVAPLRPGTILSRDELEARTRRAETELATARARVQEAGFRNGLRADTAEYFAFLGPFSLLAGAWFLRRTPALEIAVYASPVVAAMLLLGTPVHGLVLVAVVLLVLFAIRRHSADTAASDA